MFHLIPALHYLVAEGNEDDWYGWDSVVSTSSTAAADAPTSLMDTSVASTSAGSTPTASVYDESASCSFNCGASTSGASTSDDATSGTEAYHSATGLCRACAAQLRVDDHGPVKVTRGGAVSGRHCVTSRAMRIDDGDLVFHLAEGVEAMRNDASCSRDDTLASCDLSVEVSSSLSDDLSPDSNSSQVYYDTADDKVEDGIESVQNLSNIKSRFQGRDEKPPMPGDAMTRSQRSSVSPSNGHVNGDRTPPEVVNRSESSEDILGRELPPVNMARSLASKFRELESSETSPSADRKPVRKITPPREDVARDVGYYNEAVERHEDIIRADDSAEKEDELPPPSFTKNMLAKFKEMEDTQKPPPSPARSTSPTKRTHRPIVSHTYMKSSPDEGIADTEPSTNGHQRQSAEVIRESDKNEMEELPERGFTKSLVSQWRQIEQTAGPSSSGGKSPLAPRQFGVISSSRNTLRQESDEHREVVRESDNFEEENLPPPSYTKNMLAKFQNIQHEAQKDSATTSTKKHFKWTVRGAKPLWGGASEDLHPQSVHGHGETASNGVNGDDFSSSEEEEEYYDEADIELECDEYGNPLYPTSHPKHPDNIRKRKEIRRQARRTAVESGSQVHAETEVEIPAPHRTKRLLSQFKSMEDMSALPPSPQTAMQRQRSMRPSASSISSGRYSASSMDSHEHLDCPETMSSDNDVAHDYEDQLHGHVVCEADTEMAAELPEQGTTRNLLARFQSLQAV